MKALMKHISHNYFNGEVDFSSFDELDIKVTKHPEFDIYKLNYSQISSPKIDPVVRDCRGTIVDKFGNPVAVSFSRFFNLGEAEEITSKFDWSNFTAQEKVDGSLILFYNFNNQWYVSTRGSFGTQEICEGSPTWSELVFNLIESTIVHFDETKTYIFELCSLYNKVVREYKTPTLYLLSIFDTETGEEFDSNSVDCFAVGIGLKQPIRYDFKTLDEVMKFIQYQEENDVTFEGAVVKDCNGMRLKIKSSTYISLHQLKGNGSIVNTKNIVPFILAGEVDEIIAYFPELKTRVNEVEIEVYNLMYELEDAFDKCKDITDQKEFALAIKNCRMNSILFRLKKENRLALNDVYDMFRTSDVSIIKILKG